MKVLVTGATGFIGRYVIEQLLQKGCTVIATSSKESSAAKFDWYPQTTYLPLNFRELDLQTDYFIWFQSPDLVIHLVWEGLPNFKAPFHFEDNLWKHYGFLKNLVQHGAQDITVTGTCLEYGLQGGKLKEDMCVCPVTSYGIAKNTLRLFLEQLQMEHPFHLKWLRLFYLYGDGQHPKSLLPQLHQALASGADEFKMSNGEQTRDYLPVEQVASNIVATAMQTKITGIINCSSNQPVTINKLVENFLKEKGKSIHLVKGAYPYPDYEPMHFWGDNEKLKKITG